MRWSRWWAGFSRPPPGTPRIGPFRYVRFHNGVHGIGVGEDELLPWAEQLRGDANSGIDAYVYFNNDPEGHAIVDAQRLMALLGPLAARPALPGQITLGSLDLDQPSAPEA